MSDRTLLLFCIASTLGAQVPPADPTRLQKELTPMGAMRAGNADGSIPAWDGGLQTAAAAGFADFAAGSLHPDPFAADEPLFTITAENVAKYADHLTAGQRAQFAANAAFAMRVYPTRRSAAFPPHAYLAVQKNVATAKLTGTGAGVEGVCGAVPFPMPQDGLQALWNHLLRFRAVHVHCSRIQATVKADGAVDRMRCIDDALYRYAAPDQTAEGLGDVLSMHKRRIEPEHALAGRMLLVHELRDYSEAAGPVWTFDLRTRRPKRAPDQRFDTPCIGSNVHVQDQVDVWNGSPERFDWTLVGGREVYVPYNSYRLHGLLRHDDVLTPRHLNPAYVRYELHRVWVVEGKLRQGARHIFKRRTLYLDEDSWQAVAADLYNGRDELWRTSEAHVVCCYDVPTVWATVEVHTDLKTGSYVATGLDHEAAKCCDFEAPLTAADFTPELLRAAAPR